MAQGGSSSNWQPAFPINEAGDTTEYYSSNSSSDSDSDFISINQVRADPILQNLMRARKQKRQNPQQQAAEKLRKEKNKLQYLEGKLMRRTNKADKEFRELTEIGQKLEEQKEKLEIKGAELEKQDKQLEIWFVKEKENLGTINDKLDERFGSVQNQRKENDRRCEKQTHSMSVAAKQEEGVHNNIILLSKVYPIHPVDDSELNGK